MRKIDVESNSGKIIRALGFGIGITISLSNKRHVYNMSKILIKKIFGFNELPKNTPHYFNKLRKQKLISFEEKGDTCEIKLTEEGKQVFLCFNYEKLEIKKSKIWDRQFRMIIFDIPENKRSARDSLRKKLKELNCVKYNDSVWIYPFPCEDEINFIANYWKVGKYVQFALVKDLTNKEKLENFFNL